MWLLHLDRWNGKQVLTWEAHVCHDVALPGLDGGHLLKEVLPGDEPDGGQECDDRNPDPIVAGVAISIVEADFLARLVLSPALWWDAAKDDDREELQEEAMCQEGECHKQRTWEICAF